MSENKVYDVITNKIIEKLEQGTVPWRKPWVGPDFAMPKSFNTKKNYRGINCFMLSIFGCDEYYLTFNQTKKLKASIKKGSKGLPVIFWSEYKRKYENQDGEQKEEMSYFLRYYTVFGLSQIDDLDYEAPDTKQIDFDPIEKCEQVLNEIPTPAPGLAYRSQRACYTPGDDLINMPDKDSFGSPEEYYNTHFHELVHATGHKSRLNRPDLNKLAGFGDNTYAKEELVAEMGAAFLSGQCHLEDKTLDNSASYLQGWLKALRNDSKLLIHAAGQAQKASDYLLNIELNK